MAAYEVWPGSAAVSNRNWTDCLSRDTQVIEGLEVGEALKFTVHVAAASGKHGWTSQASGEDACIWQHGMFRTPVAEVIAEAC